MIAILGVIMIVIEADMVTRVVDRYLSVTAIIAAGGILLRVSVGSNVVILGKKIEDIMIEVEDLDVDMIMGMEEGTEISWMKMSSSSIIIV